MSLVVLPILYIRWHYSRALRDFFGIWSNVLWFIGNLFSVKILIRTLLQPLKLISEEKGSFLSDPTEYAQNLLINLIMRIVGMLTRLTLIIVALSAWVILCVLGVAAFVLWLILPLVLVGMLGKGFSLIF